MIHLSRRLRVNGVLVHVRVVVDLLVGWSLIFGAPQVITQLMRRNSDLAKPPKSTNDKQDMCLAAAA